MKTLRSYLALMLSLTLVLTGSAMAQGRMMNPATGEMVLCTGAGSVVVLVDAEGQPTGKPHICPDCALGFVAVLTEQPTAEMPARAVATALLPVTQNATPTPRFLHNKARAPPLTI